MALIICSLNLLVIHSDKGTQLSLLLFWFLFSFLKLPLQSFFPLSYGLGILFGLIT